MDPGGAITVAIPTAAIAAAAPYIIRWFMGWRATRNGTSGDRFKAVLVDTSKRVETLHEALGKKNPNTDGFIILESLNEMRNHIVKQTPLIERQANALEKQNILLEKLGSQMSGQFRSPGKY